MNPATELYLKIGGAQNILPAVVGCRANGLQSAPQIVVTDW
ncbi:hypothetical protein V466_28915 [Pseudomonas mandelii PD30]|uniref:Uncharacterized protein n=1 Tax=Pseudomonas mandelii PD30 TaxID=1419583 RepID=A0A059KUG2_9PSED|nr:hypothetical protein [Pseudomonas mandelii]KDD65500.1 hypothetical protein V466_28915 [Pseudomonas mandelii PD30]